jgi:hypothetical protein
MAQEKIKPQKPRPSPSPLKTALAAEKPHAGKNLFSNF